MLTFNELRGLVADLESDDLRIAEHAKKTLVRLKDKRCIPLLLRQVVAISNVGLTSAVVILLGFKENDAICRYLVRMLKSREPFYREGAAIGLMDIPQRKSFRHLLECARNERSKAARSFALYALQRWYAFFGSKETAPTREVEEILKVHAAATRLKTSSFRGAGFAGLSLICDPRFDHYLKKASRDPRWEIREGAKTWRKHVRLRNSKEVPGKPLLARR